MAIERLTVLKLVGLAVGCLAKFTTGSLFVFNVYQNAIKDTFNYTQKEVEVLPSMMNIGQNFAFVMGMFYDRFGPQWSSVMGLLVSVTGYMLIWSTTKNVQFYSHNSWLMAIYFFIVGFGSVFTYMVALNTNVINFDKKHTGIIVGILNSFFSGSPAVFATIYYNIFSQGDRTDMKKEEFSRFMLMFAVLFAIVDTLCVIFLKLYKDERSGFQSLEDESINNDRGIKDPETEAKDNVTHVSRLVANEVSYGSKEGDCTTETSGTFTDQVAFEQLPLITLLRNVEYQVFMWIVAFSTTIILVYFINITVISRSMTLDKYDNMLTIIIPISEALLSILVGLFSDRFKDRIPRVWLITFGNMFLTVSQILVFLCAIEFGALVLATILVGVGAAFIWSIAPTVLKEMFNEKQFGRNFGIILSVAAVVGFIVQVLFGVLYDAEALKEDSLHCYGIACIRGGVGLLIACGFISVGLGIYFHIRERKP